MSADVVVIAGTADARQIIGKLLEKGIPTAATVATGYGSELLSGYPGLEVYEGRLTGEEMADLLKRTGAKCLIDASHPFAKEVSVNAIHACETAGVPYIRYERSHTDTGKAEVIRVGDFTEAAKLLSRMKGNILLTVGSNNLDVFTENVEDFKERMFIRVLPEGKVLQKCEAAGFSASNIIAMKGPFTVAMNVEMIKYCKAQVLVTKDSGAEGGLPEKLRAAELTDIKVIMVERPGIEYKHKVTKIKDAVEYAVSLCTTGEMV